MENTNQPINGMADYSSDMITKIEQAAQADIPFLPEDTEQIKLIKENFVLKNQVSRYQEEIRCLNLQLQFFHDKYYECRDELMKMEESHAGYLNEDRINHMSAIMRTLKYDIAALDMEVKNMIRNKTNIDTQ